MSETLETQPWFFGRIDRFEAEGHLMSPENEDGTFLIRRSDSHSVGYVLSVRSSTRVKHFKVLQENNTYRIEPSPQFPSLIDLVGHYCSNSLRTTGRLGKPCKKPEMSELGVDVPTLSKEEFSLEEELSRGVFSDVYRGRWKNNVNVAVKIIKSDLELNHSEFFNELRHLSNLRHRHLLSLLAVCTDSEPFYLVTELMEKGSLLTFLRGPEGQHQDIVSLVDMGAQVAEGMAYLEKKNILHRDLAARNVLVGGNCICKVSGIIKLPFYFTDDKKIPYRWSAPEALTHGTFSNKSDVWSYGVLLYEIITFGGIPYPDFSDEEVQKKVTDGYRMSCPPKCPRLFYDTMMDCWRADPEDRPTFKNLLCQLDLTSYE